MQGTSSVAIVIPCFGHARVLGGAIDSALAQTVPPAELVIVDDGSRDDPAAVVRKYPQARLVRQANRGPSAARNAGLREVASERVIFLDADDRLLPGAIAAGLDCFAARPDAGFVYGGYLDVRWSGESQRIRPVATRCDLIRCNWVGMIGAVMFDRSRLVEVGGFDESLRMAEDWDLFLRMSRSFPFAAHPQIVARYVRHRRNATGDLAAVRRGIEVVRRREWERGLSDAEQQAWREGADVVAAAYPGPLQRLMRLGPRIVARLLGK